MAAEVLKLPRHLLKDFHDLYHWLLVLLYHAVRVAVDNDWMLLKRHVTMSVPRMVLPHDDDLFREALLVVLFPEM